MGDPFRQETFPRGALTGAAFLVFGALVLAAAGRFTGLGVSQVPQVPAVASVELRFEPLADGTLVIVDTREGRALAEFAPDTEGFVRGVLRGLERERTVARVGPAAPYVLTRWADGRLSIADPATGNRIDLQGFGPDNLAAFARFLPEHR